MHSHTQKKNAGRLAVLTASALVVAGLTAASSSAAVVPVSLAKANSFAVVVGGGIANVGQSTIVGDLALTPVINYSDTGLLTLKGDYHFGDAAALNAQAAVTAAYNVAASETPSVTAASELAGQTLLPGIYSNAVGLSINGSLNLDAQNNPNALFIIQTPLALLTGAASHVNLLNGAQACNVFWQVGTTSTLGAGSDFKGNLLGKGNFVSNAGSVVLGRVLIGTGSVSLNATSISRPQCKDIDVKSAGNLLNGGGSYVSQYGNTSFNFDLKGSDLGNGTFTNVDGKVTWTTAKGWMFKGTPTAYSYTNGVGTITGTGNLTYFSSPKKGKDGRWVSATTGAANFTIKYTRVTNANGTLGKVNTFAIGFTGTVIAGVPQLPALGALVQVKGGGSSDD